MPYKSPKELPASVRGALPPHALRVFTSVVNGRLKAGQSDEAAFRQAWAAVKNGWQKPKNGGKWQRIKKDDGFVLYSEALESDRIVFKADQTDVDEKLGIVFGWGLVTKLQNADGQFEPYYDLQGDHIPDESMLKAVTGFMRDGGAHKAMHDGDEFGKVVFCFPLSEDIAKAMGISSPKLGLMIGVMPDDQATLDKFASGEFSGFSIGGSRIIDEIEGIEVGGEADEIRVS